MWEPSKDTTQQGRLSSEKICCADPKQWPFHQDVGVSQKSLYTNEIGGDIKTKHVFLRNDGEGRRKVLDFTTRQATLHRRSSPSHEGVD